MKSEFESLAKNLEKMPKAKECDSTGIIVIINNNSTYSDNVSDNKCFFQR